MRKHLDDFLAEARDNYARGLPRYVERELRSYLKCGLPTVITRRIREVAG